MAHDHRMNPVNSNHRPTPRLQQAIASHLGIPSEQAQDVLDAHRMGSEEEVYAGSTWDHDREMVDVQNKVTQKGGIKDAISSSIENRNGGWYNPESAMSWGAK